MISGAHTSLSDPQVNEYTVSVFGFESACLLVTRINVCNIAYSTVCVGGSGW